MRRNRRLWRWAIVLSFPLALWTLVGCAQVAGIRVAKDNDKCQDGIKNNDESGIDCGGPCLGACPEQPCSGNADCASGKCSKGECLKPTCSDKILNGRERTLDVCPKSSGCDEGSEECGPMT